MMTSKADKNKFDLTFKIPKMLVAGIEFETEIDNREGSIG